MAQEHHDALELPSSEKPQNDSDQATGSNNAEQLEEQLESDSPEYPSGMKLTFIFVALCLTVFLVALVRILRTSFLMQWSLEVDRMDG